MGPGQNPISVLQEFFQQAGKPFPEYTFQQAGPPHTPVITCQCRFGDQTVEVKAGSKKAAKTEAAAKALEQLHGG